MPDSGQKPAIVLIPGIQGRWEWMAPAVHALEADYRVLTFSLSDVPTPPDNGSAPGWFNSWASHIDGLLGSAGVSKAIVSGVSFGSLVAIHYAAVRPGSTSALVLASPPGPQLGDDPDYDARLRSPVLALPGFAVRGMMRMAPEIAATHPGWIDRVKFAVPQTARVLAAPPSPRLMAEWVREWRRTDFAALSRRITAPTLVVTGDPALDRIVPVDSSREYLSLIQGARYACLPRTGHLGVVLQADRFARMVRDFVHDVS
jgi:pimeloyl-ACP methyl ester carboxylesterase